MDPAEIQFHGDELGIRFGEKEIVRELAAEGFGGIEFEGVIVVAELDASLLAGFAGFIKKIRGALPTVRILALLFVNPGTNDVAVSDDLGGFESCCNGSADKCSSIHGRHFTPFERKGNRDSVRKKGRSDDARPPLFG